MAITLVQSCVSSTAGTNTTTATCALGAGVTAGNTLIAVTMNAGSTIPTVTDSNNTWHHAINGTYGAGVSAIDYSYNVAAGSYTVTSTFGGNYSFVGYSLIEVSGLGTSDPLDQKSFLSISGTANPLNGTPVTTTSANEFLISICNASGASGTLTAGSGWTQPANGSNANNSNVWEYRIASSIGTFTPSFANASSGSSAAVAIATFKAGSSGGGSSSSWLTVNLNNSLRGVRH